MLSCDIQLLSCLSEEKYGKEFRETFQRTFNSIFTLCLTLILHTMVQTIELHMLYLSLFDYNEHKCLNKFVCMRFFSIINLNTGEFNTYSKFFYTLLRFVIVLIKCNY